MYYTGTQTECQSYNEIVTIGEGYKAPTETWFNPIELNGSWYVKKNNDYISNMEEVASLPSLDI